MNPDWQRRLDRLRCMVNAPRWVTVAPIGDQGGEPVERCAYCQTPRGGGRHA